MTSTSLVLEDQLGLDQRIILIGIAFNDVITDTVAIKSLVVEIYIRVFILVGMHDHRLQAFGTLADR